MVLSDVVVAAAVVVVAVTYLLLLPVLWIRIRMDPELLPGSGIIVPDPDPAKSERAYK